jgi:hypothetical protein
LAVAPRTDWQGQIDVALLSLALLALVMRLLQPTSHVTGLLVLAAAMLIPGAVVAQLLSLQDPLAWFAVCVSSSLASVVLGSMAMLWSGVWSPDVLAAVLFACSATALAAHSLGIWGAAEPGTSTQRRSI